MTKGFYDTMTFMSSVESYKHTFSESRLWKILAGSMVVMFSVLLYYGKEIYRLAPPIPDTVVSASGEILFSKEDIQTGQNVWQSMGGMQQGSIWGHGSYLAPDWSADWLRREALSLTDIYSERYAERSIFGDGEVSEGVVNTTNMAPILEVNDIKTLVKAKVEGEFRRNTYADGVITVSDERADAIAATSEHYKSLFQGGSEESLDLRRDYGFPIESFLTDEEVRAVSGFFFWTSWSSSTNRPNDDITYTSNWPHEPLVGNVPSPGVLMWSLISVLLLLMGIGALVWYYARQFDIWRKDMEPDEGYAKHDALKAITNTPSMIATAKYFWVVVALFLVQILLGILTAHYQVEGQGLYGLSIADYFPYSLTRTWHTQIAVLWIATAWLAAGLYFAPLLSGHEPRFQKFGVNFLFISLLVIVVGSFVGQFLAIHRMIPDLMYNFWFGHQGYEYIDLGRFWQTYLFVGLLLWLVLMLRALLPLFKRGKGSLSLLYLLVLSIVAIGLLYGAGFLWGQHTHIAIVEYWRWWVVHLWVEGVFEVFATAIVAVLFVKLGLIRVSVATVSVMLATIIFLCGGVLGLFHHLYWTGTPIAVLALGAVFSALEVVPLTVVGFEAYQHSKMERTVDWVKNYKWPLMFIAGVLFWNLIGAGVFGFLINPPIALYYMQGLHSTANHGHAALFGVYGMLGIGLMLFCMRGLTDINTWNNKLLSISFWSLQIGMILMTFFSLFPMGLYQAYHSIKYSYAYARSSEFVHSGPMEFLVWARVPGDIIFAIGAFAFALFVYQAFRDSSRATQVSHQTTHN